VSSREPTAPPAPDDDRLFPDGYLATVGVFDGVHRGHRAILDAMVAEGARRGLPCLVATFHPRPVRVFAPDAPADELTPLRRKIRLLAEIGVARVLAIRFSHVFAEMEPEEFLGRVLGAGTGLRGLWIGHDFRFGRDRRGDWDLVRAAGVRHGFDTHRIEALQLGSAVISSSAIRRCLNEGRVEDAAMMLGRLPEIEGRVVTGRGQGAKVLVPTANLALPPEHVLPATGVYAGTAEWDGIEHRAVMNLGRRPTLTGGDDLVPEVHVLDWNGDLLGRSLSFRMRMRVREEQNFPSIKELREQIDRDIDQARCLPEWKPM
jgi:riboflavin kinase/FMN adenylyltransferase